MEGLLVPPFRGRTNQFLINTRHALAIGYNDRSVLEHFHVAETFKLGLTAGCDVFAHLKRADYNALRALMIRMVLATVQAAAGQGAVAPFAHAQCAHRMCRPTLNMWHT